MALTSNVNAIPEGENGSRSNAPPLLLSDLRVIDFSTEIAGPYTTKLFSDAGAEVIKVESAAGDPLRSRAAYGEKVAGRDSALFRYLHAGKKSVIGKPRDPDIEALVAEADLVVESGSPSVDVERWRAKFPHLVILTLSPYGRPGPYADRPATPFTVEAESGSLSARGLLEGEPFQVGGRLLEWAQGTYAAVGALAAVVRSRATGVGEWVDSSLLVAAHFSSAGGRLTMHAVDGYPSTTVPPRVIEVPSVEPTKDGWVGFSLNSHQQFSDFMGMIEQSQLLEDQPDWASYHYRFEHLTEWNKLVETWTRARTTEEIIDLASSLRIPVAPVTSGQSILEFEQFRLRSAIAASSDGEFLQPQPPIMINRTRPRVRGRAPLLGEHTSLVQSRPGRHRNTTSDDSAGRLPFDGCRVLDATGWWAGPAVGEVFASLGADVIHLESVGRPDGMRMVVGYAQRDQPQWWERGGIGLVTNANKRGLTLPLNHPAGKDLFERLLPSCDLLIENFSPRVFDNFGITAERVLEINPRLVFLRMPAFGLDGPWRDAVGMAVTMEQVTGLAWRTGHTYDPPRCPRGPCDPLGGYHAAFAAIAALHRRSRDGRGTFLESAMAEAILNCAAEAIVTYTSEGVLIEREGNRCPEGAPQGLYRTRGHEQWLALSVTDDSQWLALRSAIGNPAWACAEELNTHTGRRCHHDEIDAELRQWAAEQDLATTVAKLIEKGVPAGTLRDFRTSDQHPQFRALGHFEVVNHPVVGRHPVEGLPFRFSSVDRWIRSAAPTLGQHNGEILTELLGLSDSEVEQLQRQGLIGTRPHGA